MKHKRGDLIKLTSPIETSTCKLFIGEEVRITYVDKLFRTYDIEKANDPKVYITDVSQKEVEEVRL